MFRTLYSRLLFFSLVLSLGGILFVGVAAFFGFQESFSSYVENRREEQIIQTLEQVEEDYRQHGSFTSQSESILHRVTMQENVVFQLYSTDDELLINSAQTDNHMDERRGGSGKGNGMMGMMGNMMGGNHMSSETYELYVDDTFVGTMNVQFPPSFAGTENQFLADFTRYVIIAIIIMTSLAILFSFVFSKQLTKGIKEIGGAVQRLKSHRHQVLSTNHHIQELKELSEGVNDLSESLQKGEQLRKQFTSDLAHELRTPLSTLRSQLEAFQDGVLEPTPERLEQSYDELMRLVRLVNEMEQLHAAENPRKKLDIKRLDSMKVLSSIKERFEPSFQEKDISLIVPLEESFTFEADHDRFIQVMTNLLNNAWKFTMPGNKVEISVTQDNQFTHFTVLDEGKGMSEEEINHAFDRFYRGEKSRNPERGGLGIGLAIVKALVEAHAGKIQIESKPNIGTAFTVSFPNPT
ncbi:sensor histidine kinase [Salipaludibacillus daqingensis]|uniref:sensor histidine kinase n=1 Tax=Salipaludibacillus daqingensis TaxID=3041001 RepID=UPI0024753081|nr:HAMP domain-containing sensor histidine kinase [Salipaludibacillus daqingensis]